MERVWHINRELSLVQQQVMWNTRSVLKDLRLLPLRLSAVSPLLSETQGGTEEVNPGITAKAP